MLNWFTPSFRLILDDYTIYEETFTIYGRQTLKIPYYLGEVSQRIMVWTHGSWKVYLLTGF